MRVLALFLCLVLPACSSLSEGIPEDVVPPPVPGGGRRTPSGSRITSSFALNCRCASATSAARASGSSSRRCGKMRREGLAKFHPRQLWSEFLYFAFRGLSADGADQRKLTNRRRAPGALASSPGRRQSHSRPMPSCRASVLAPSSKGEHGFAIRNSRSMVPLGPRQPAGSVNR